MTIAPEALSKEKPTRPKRKKLKDQEEARNTFKSSISISPEAAAIVKRRPARAKEKGRRNSFKKIICRPGRKLRSKRKQLRTKKKQ
jgi:hypothetical protein